MGNFYSIKSKANGKKLLGGSQDIEYKKKFTVCKATKLTIFI